MARKRRKRPSSQAPAAAPPAATTAATSGWPNRLPLLAAVLVLVAYTALFYRLPLGPQAVDPQTGQPVRRIQYLLLLLVSPDYLLECWTGGDWDRVNLIDRLPVVAVAAAILLVAWALGRLLLAAAHQVDGLRRLEIFVISLGVGLSLLSLCTLAIGLAGQLRSGLCPLAPLLLLAAVALWAWLDRRRRQTGRHEADQPLADGPARIEPHEWLPLKTLWLAVPFVLCITLGAILPPREFDVREYHLQVPKEWYQQGRIGFLPHNVYGNMPLGAEMHALLAMTIMTGPRRWWWGALAGKTVIAMFAPLGMLALVAAARRRFGRTAGVVAGLVFISTPWIARVSMSGLIDGAVAAYVALALCAVGIWSDEHRLGEATDETPNGATAPRPGPATGRLALAGFLAGSAVACKYPALLFVALPLGVWVGVVSRRPKAVAVFVLAMLLACGPWFAKNWVLTGNPTYPLLAQVLDGKTRTPAKDAQWRHAHRVPPDQRGRRYSAAQLVAAAGQVTLSSPWLSPLLVPLAVLAVLVKRGRRRLLAVLGWYLYFLAAWWLVTHRIERFWVPALPLVALLAGAGASWTAVRPWRWLLVATLAVGLLSNWLMIASPATGDVRFLVALEQLRADVPRPNDPIPSRVDPAHRYLNTVTPPGRAVLLVGDAQPFDLEVPVLYNTCFDDCIFERLMKGRSAGQRRRALAQHKIAFIYVNWNELARYRSPGNYGYAAGSTFVRPELLRELVAQGVLEKPIVFADRQLPDSPYPPPEIYPVAAVNFANGR